MYFNHVKVKDISDRTKVPVETIRVWIWKKGWTDKRDREARMVMEEIASRKKGQLWRIQELLLDGIEAGLEKEIKRGINPKDLPKYADMAANLDKLLRLTHNMATDIKEERHTHAHAHFKLTDRQNIMKIIQADPMLSLEMNTAVEEAKKEEDPKRVISMEQLHAEQALERELDESE